MDEMTTDNQELQELIGKDSKLDFTAFLREIQADEKANEEAILELEHNIDDLSDSLQSPQYASKQRTSGLSIDEESSLLQQVERELEELEEQEELNKLKKREAAAARKTLEEEDEEDEDERPATPEEEEAYAASYLKAVEEKKKRFKEANKVSQKVRREKLRKQKLLKIEIQRKALAQDALDISELMPIESMQKLIEMLTAKYRHLVARYEDLITRHVEALLKKHTPVQLRALYKAYPQAFIKHPGFMYQAGEEFGGGHKFWVMPDLPYFLPQFTETAVMRERNETRCINIDRLVKRLYNTRNILHETELRIGSLLANLMPQHTYYTLLMHHPFWFIMLYEYETGLSLGVYDKVAELQYHKTAANGRRRKITGHV